MARRLVTAGFAVTVWNRDHAKTAPLAAAGARAAESPRAAAQDADVIVSMVADDPVSRAVWTGENGALKGAKRGALCIESSTLTVAWVRELATRAEAHGCELIDAPVTGSRAAAANGELNFLVGGSAAALERARPVLAAMSKTVRHLGPTGSGALIKLINNFVCGVHLASIAEALAMMERGGLDKNLALPVLTEGAPGSPMVKAVSGRMMAADYHAPHFKLKLMGKDLAYAQQEGAELGLDLLTAKGALAEIQKGVAAGLGEQDIAAVFEALRK
jgi:3-hydroxyisobutyrate dehydrogenase